MQVVRKIVHSGIILTVISLFGCLVYASFQHEPNWNVEKSAVREATHPLSGFWKQDDCEDPWGMAIGPVGAGTYYVSFCGPGGCFDKGDYRPNTNIVDDPDFQVFDDNNMMYRSESGWSTLVRCPSR
jgi:hypothetical protein